MACNSKIIAVPALSTFLMWNPKVLISGSGIAGSAFAFCLLKAYPKAEITIVERAPSLRLTGASVGTWVHLNYKHSLVVI